MSEKTIKIQCSGASSLPLDLIEDFQGNLKKRGKKEIEKIVKSIETYGFSFPFFVWNGTGHNYCLDGHGRLEALAEMRRRGYDLPMFPVAYIEAQDEAEAKNKLLRLNSQYGQMTVDSVLEFTEGLEIDFDDLALPDGVLEFEPKKQEETIGDDEAPALEDGEPDSKLGEIYELGPHRLMCGDSTDAEQVRLLMGGEKADMMHTDPPYNVNYDNQARPKAGKNKLGKIKNDLMDDDSFFVFLFNFYSCSNIFLKDDSSIYIWHASSEQVNFTKAMVDSGFEYKQQIIWKKPMLLGRGKYQWAHEPCLFGVKGSPYFTKDRTKTTVWDFGGYDKSKNIHPTQKPVFIPKEAIENSSQESDIILDLFGGSGSTLIACAKTNRQCRMMELDPKYCDVIRRRWTTWARQNGQEVGSGALEPLEAL